MMGILPEIGIRIRIGNTNPIGKLESEFKMIRIMIYDRNSNFKRFKS